MCMQALLFFFLYIIKLYGGALKLSVIIHIHRKTMTLQPPLRQFLFLISVFSKEWGSSCDKFT